MSKYDEIAALLNKQFGNGKDIIISLATIGQFPSADGNIRPAVRNVDSIYEDGVFYTVTYAKSNKMQEIAANPEVALDVCRKWFTANGVGKNLGWVRDEKNAEIMSKIRAAFAQWYDNGHTNEEDPNTCLLRIDLTSGVLLRQGKRYIIDFVNRTA